MHKILTLCFILLFFNSAFAWDKIGHRVVGEIAEKLLSKKTLAKVNNLLENESLAEVANWPDLIRSDASWTKASPWHYVNIPDGQTYSDSTKNPDGDVVWAIQHFSAILKQKNASKEDKKQPLKFLVHFVGDLHQPLHVGLAEDRGGNLKMVKWFDHETNLHAVWDKFIIDFQQYSYTEYTQVLLRKLTKPEQQSWSKDGLLTWVEESQKLRQEIYKNKETELSYDYNFLFIPTINRRLLQGGVRLAALLEKSLN